MVGGCLGEWMVGGYLSGRVGVNMRLRARASWHFHNYRASGGNIYNIYCSLFFMLLSDRSTYVMKRFGFFEILCKNQRDSGFSCALATWLPCQYPTRYEDVTSIKQTNIYFSVVLFECLQIF